MAECNLPGLSVLHHPGDPHPRPAQPLLGGLVRRRLSRLHLRDGLPRLQLAADKGSTIRTVYIAGIELP